MRGKRQSLVGDHRAFVMQAPAENTCWFGKPRRVPIVIGCCFIVGLGATHVTAAGGPKISVVAPITNKMTEPMPADHAIPDQTNSAAGEAALRAAFQTHLRELWPQARDLGISQGVFDAAIADLVLDASIVELAGNQPEHAWAPWDYLDRLVSDQRIADGGLKFTEMSDLLTRIEKRYGVSRHVVVAIWGIESNYGTSPGARNVLRSLATLSHSGGRRAGFAREQFLNALQILQNGDVTADKMTGSWAGAMGHTQFIPSTYNAHAVDFDGDGRRDIWGTVADALASTANYLKVSGWQPDTPWGYEVRLPEGFGFVLGTANSKSAGDWSAAGLTRPDGTPIANLDAPLKLVLPAGAHGPSFLVTPNFKAILRYNHSVVYALAVGLLSERLQGGAGVQGKWPKDDPPLAAKERVELQELLVGHGFSTGGVDGIVGRETRAAVRAYQEQRGLAPDGYPGSKLLGSLRADVRR